MRATPITLDELIAALPSGEARAKIMRALDAERAAAKRDYEHLREKLDAATQTLRDEFAKAALPTTIALNQYAVNASEEAFAAWSYAQADAMLVAREKKAVPA